MPHLTVTPITVAQLIAHLQTLPQHLPVAYRRYSEQVALELEDIEVEQLGPIRPDGWIANARPDKPLTTYVVFPGN